jgi:hypothetical protein
MDALGCTRSRSIGRARPQPLQLSKGIPFAKRWFIRHRTGAGKILQKVSEKSLGDTMVWSPLPGGNRERHFYQESPPK